MNTAAQSGGISGAPEPASLGTCGPVNRSHPVVARRYSSSMPRPSPEQERVW